jgi:hypothetical protein
MELRERAMGRFSLRFEDESRPLKRNRSALAAALSFLRLLATTTLMAYVIVYCWIWATGDTTVARLIRIF